MNGRTFEIEVHSVSPGCQVSVGLKSPELQGTVLIGRDRSARFMLQDQTVSRRHVELELLPLGFRVHNLSARGTTCVNTARLAPDGVHEHAEEEMWLQVGRILLRVLVTPTTIPADELLPIPDSRLFLPEAPKLLHLREFHDRWEVSFSGQPQRVFPSAARVLARLSQTPGEVVSHASLAEAADPEHYPRQGGATVPQLITFIRNAFDSAIDAGDLDPQRLHALVFQDDPTPPPVDDHRRLLRALVENIRGLGYRLRLPAYEISLE